MKKFKEFRMLIVCLSILFILGGCTIYWLVANEIGLAIAGILLSSIDLMLLVARYKMVLFDDMMMIYEWKVIAMLPTMIEYCDIQSIEVKSKHHIIITHKHVSHVYVLNSEAFMNAYKELRGLL